MATNVQTRDIFIAHGWEYNEYIQKLIDALDRAGEFDDQFAYINYGEFDKNIPKENNAENLEEIIKGQIDNSAVVLVLTDLYREYKDWIDRELELAKEMNKPVILIRSYENRVSPSHLEEAADEVIVFDPEEILKEVKNYAN